MVRQAIEHENLDHAILVAVPPLQRHSCRVLELRRAETSLAAMKQYYDAMMASRFDVAHEKLRLKHKEQQARQHEHIGTIKWSSKRRAEKHASIQRHKCANLDLDMRQANAFDQCKSP